MFLTFH